MPVMSSRQMVEQALACVTTHSAEEALALHARADVLFVDIREPAELQREGQVPGAFHAPRGVLEFWVDPVSAWHKPALAQPGIQMVLYCAVGWRSALAALALQQMGVDNVSHLGGGLVAWKAAGGPVDKSVE
jgi:rhodanese-related sulfurtransferase